MSNTVSNTFSILSGAALGVVAAYLLDPDKGATRRNEIFNAAAGTANRAEKAVKASVHDTAGSAKNLAATISDYAHHLADHVSSHAADASDQVHGAVNQARTQAGSLQPLVNRARGYANQWLDRGNAAVHQLSDRAKSSLKAQTGWEPAHSHSIAGVTLETLATLTVGAAAMYFLDPARGHSRRVWAEDKIFSLGNRASKRATSYGRHLANKAQGVAAQAKQAMPENWSKAVDQAVDHAADVAAKVVQNSSEPQPSH